MRRLVLSLCRASAEVKVIFGKLDKNQVSGVMTAGQGERRLTLGSSLTAVLCVV